jgi:ribosomal protein S1
MDKLIESCIHKFKTRDERKAKLMQSQDKANKISMGTKQLSDKLNQLTNIMP